MKYVQITPDIYPSEESSKKKSFTLQKFLTQSSYKTDLKHIICRNKLIEKKELELIAVQLSKSINQKVILHTQGNFEEFLQGPTVSLIDKIEKPFLDYVEGLHITSGDLLRLDKDHIQFLRKNKYFTNKDGKVGASVIGASCHNIRELEAAANLNLDYCLLGPIRQKYKSSTPLGWKNFNSLASDVSIPVYALGGLSILDTEDAKKNNAHGIAGISMFINS